MNLFYSPNLRHSNLLPEDESAHAVRVLRLKQGDSIEVIDGKGLLCRAEIALAHPKCCEFRVVEKTFAENPRKFNLHIAIAPTKSTDRFECFVEKATEIGIDTITPILCRFSERKSLKNERPEKIIISACKQSKNFYFPEIHELTEFDKFIRAIANKSLSVDRYNGDNSEVQKFIAHCHEGEKAQLKNICAPQTDTIILIGPEGDFSHEETLLAEQCGFTSVNLGSSRLRTETAGIIACATVGFVQ
ncbi:MAG: 16S rRNA (uracil(1498)-N(3))-methyltransferase [Prevotellaceae bacterium]|jgi:16S rRNA (uracil1498-N3)-methyltransferase|nr:16S rRNA (uracil(1498)-N(3))-methyltransferase [Prevotellaceae bacterium]